MFKKTILRSAAVALVAFTAVASWAAEEYQIDRVHSSIGFAVRHMVVSKVKGEFNEWSGIIYYDDKDIANSSVEVTFKTESIDTKDAKRDGHLKSPDFFDAASHPEITFKSKRIEQTENGHVAVGDLTMRGVTKEIRIPFEITGMITDPYGNTRVGFSAATKLNRQDYGVSWSKTLDAGGLVVSDDVEIEIELEAVKAK